MARRNLALVQRRLVPELVHFDDRKEVAALFERATQSRRSILLIMGFVIVVLLVVLFAHRALAPLLGIPGYYVQAVIQPLAMLLGFYWLFNFALRRPFQRELRRALNERGVPICMACGYDLRGQAENRCPECGLPYTPVTPLGDDGEPTQPTT